MSKLAHSNDQTMLDIELKNARVVKLPKPENPKCDVYVKGNHLVRPHQCPHIALYTKDGFRLCKPHAIKSLEQ